MDARPGGLPPLAVTGARLNVLNDPVALLKIEAQGTLEALLESSAEMKRLWRGEDQGE